MGKLDGKVAVITGGSTGMALAGAKLFADEGAQAYARVWLAELKDRRIRVNVLTPARSPRRSASCRRRHHGDLSGRH